MDEKYPFAPRESSFLGNWAHLPQGVTNVQELKLLEELGCIAQENMCALQEIESPSWQKDLNYGPST
jgi:hypothetical protein